MRFGHRGKDNWLTEEEQARLAGAALFALVFSPGIIKVKNDYFIFGDPVVKPVMLNYECTSHIFHARQRAYVWMRLQCVYPRVNSI